MADGVKLPDESIGVGDHDDNPLLGKRRENRARRLDAA
jgi:hypothetical protein